MYLLKSIPIIHLSPNDITHAEWLARTRMDASTGMNHDKYGKKKYNQIHYDRLGAYGECAVAKFLNKPLPVHVNNFHGPDIEPDIQVRAVDDDGLKLIIRPNDGDHWKFVSALVQPPYVELRGWLYGWAAKQQEFWVKRDPGAWFIPASKLRSTL